MTKFMLQYESDIETLLALVDETGEVLSTNRIPGSPVILSEFIRLRKIIIIDYDEIFHLAKELEKAFCTEWKELQRYRIVSQSKYTEAYHHSMNIYTKYCRATGSPKTYRYFIIGLPNKQPGLPG